MRVPRVPWTHSMRVALLTFGCRVNHAESLAIERDLRAAGATVVPAAEADLIVVNSCSVTATADQGTRQSVRRAARDNPTARIVVTGCYATRSPEEVKALPGVVQVVPNGRKDGLVGELSLSDPAPGSPPTPEAPARLAEVRSAREGGGLRASGLVTRDSLTACSLPLAAGVPPSRVPVLGGGGGRTAFTLRIQTGCEEPCAYCIIPTTRGASRSTPAKEIVRELQRVEDAGYKEVTLTGVHLGAYGRDLDEGCDLVGVLERVIAGTRDLVFRLGSLEPMDCTPALIDLAASTDRLAPAFHLPLQHASDRMLAAMRRPYTLAQYEQIVTDVRARLPHAAIGSDILVGFPGESDEDARKLVEWLAASPLTSLHVFPYSDRPGTEASALRNKVHGATIRERAAAVRAVGEELHARFRASQVGTDHRALTIDDGSVAVTGNGLKVRIAPGCSRNQWVRVRVREDGGGDVT
jgi:threonylcarbamoyladenosine tRNA methylthiotransferase MtaB